MFEYPEAGGEGGKHEIDEGEVLDVLASVGAVEL